MKVLPFSRMGLKFIGIKFDPNQRRFQSCYNYFIRTYGIMTMAIALIGLLYVLIYLDRVLVAVIALISIIAIKLGSQVMMLNRFDKIFSILKIVIDQLDKTATRRIIRFDCIHGIKKVLIGSGNMTLLVHYLSVHGLGPEAAAMMAGLRTEPHEDRTYVLFPLIVLNFGVISFIILIQFYSSVLFIANSLADHVCSLCEQSNTIPVDYDLMRKSLQMYNNLMQTVNHELGIIPMTLLAINFAMFANGITFMVASRVDIGVSIYFATLTIGVLTLMYLVSLLHVIFLGSKCYRKISEAWEAAEEIVADPFAVAMTEEAARTRESLKFFLITESIVPAKAADSIVLDRSLVLSFFNQLIPFTVMMFTTIKEVDHRTSSTKRTG